MSAQVIVLCAALFSLRAEAVCPLSPVTVAAEVIDGIGSDYLEFGMSVPPTPLTLTVGSFVNEYSMPREFVAGTVSGPAAFTPTNIWTAPYAEKGTIKGVVSYSQDWAGKCRISELYADDDLGTALTTLSTTDWLFIEGFHAYLALNNGMVRGINRAGLALHPTPVTLTVFQAAVQARHPLSASPDWDGSGSAAIAPTDDALSRSWRGVLGMAFLFAMSCFVLGWTYRRMRQRVE